MLVFRWSAWGDKTRTLDLLTLSLASFRRAFGTSARYVVGTDEPSATRDRLGNSAEVIPFEPGSRFDVDDVATWKKWCPTARVSPNDTEFYVDTDVFLVSDPVEVRKFAQDPGEHKYLAMREAPGAPHYVGCFRPRLWPGIPPINTGFLGQRAGVDITEDLSRELRWWQENVPLEAREYHDDQGAVVTILSRSFVLGHVGLLAQDRYSVVSRISNAGLTSVRGRAAVHLTMAAYALPRLLPEIQAYIAGTDPRPEMPPPEAIDGQASAPQRLHTSCMDEPSGGSAFLSSPSVKLQR